MKMLNIFFFVILVLCTLLNSAASMKTHLKKTSIYIKRGTVCIVDRQCGDKYHCIKSGGVFGTCK